MIFGTNFLYKIDKNKNLNEGLGFGVIVNGD